MILYPHDNYKEEPMIISNEDVKELITEIPEGHKHIRTTIVLKDGMKMTFQEATIANLVRSYIGVKTHPVNVRTVMRCRMVKDKKEDYAEWQLIEE
ncbi:MAG: hypothetical protein JSV21_03675 [Nitrospirota bacterium]|nr:MAG: hypothetical protein JSV21_03675 [Nitrospirota bacterium]